MTWSGGATAGLTLAPTMIISMEDHSHRNETDMRSRKRAKVAAGVAFAAVVAGGFALASGNANANTVPCATGNDGSSAHLTCFGNPTVRWRLAVDCVDRSNPRQPVIKTTYTGEWTTGNGTQEWTCPDGLIADPHLQLG